MTGGTVAQLGYLGFEVSDVPAWEAFATRVLGLEVAVRAPDGGLCFRLDDHAWRFAVAPGPADDLAFVGWQVDDASDLDALTQRLRAAGVEVRPGTPSQCDSRGVEAMVAFEDPAGNPMELFHGPRVAETPFTSRRMPSGFVAGDQGLGHLVVTNDDNAAHEAFFCGLLGLRLSDRIVTRIGELDLDLAFLRCNRRHHSIAFGGPQKKRIHHFGIQVPTLDDLGRILDRATRHCAPMVAMIGRHPNDRMVSSYLRTPSGFEVEIGWGGLTVDEDTWEIRTHDRVFDWGHRPPHLLAGTRSGSDG